MLVSECLLLIGIGLTVGFLAGFLGIGGGLITVPILSTLFLHHHSTATDAMHYAIGTSLSIVAINGLRALMLQPSTLLQRRQTIKQLLPGCCLGVLMAAPLSHTLPPVLLHRLFAGFTLFCLLQLLFTQKHPQLRLNSQGKWHLYAATLGFISRLLGIGGGVGVPILKRLGLNWQQAIEVGCASSFILGTLGTITATLTPGPSPTPWAVGHVIWPATIGIALGAQCTIPLGAYCAQYWPKSILKASYALFLLAVTIHMWQ